MAVMAVSALSTPLPVLQLTTPAVVVVAEGKVAVQMVLVDLAAVATQAQVKQAQQIQVEVAVEENLMQGAAVMVVQE